MIHALVLNGCKAQSVKYTSNQIQNTIHFYGEKLISDPSLNAVSIGITMNGNSYTEHFGELDEGKSNTPTDSTIYEIASVSKSFCGILIAKAVLEKRITLDDDIREYLVSGYPNFEYLEIGITIKLLLTHTSGLPRFLPLEIYSLFNNIDEQLPYRITAFE